jgi:hypothetical protein
LHDLLQLARQELPSKCGARGLENRIVSGKTNSLPTPFPLWSKSTQKTKRFQYVFSAKSKTFEKLQTNPGAGIPTERSKVTVVYFPTMRPVRKPRAEPSVNKKQ